MRTIVIDTIIAIFLIIAINIFTPAKYSNALDVQQINNVIRQMVVIETQANVLVKGEVQTRKMEAIAIRIRDGFILAETHATKVPDIALIPTPFGMFVIHQKVISEKFFAEGVEIELIGRHLDVSLFKDPSKDKYPIVPLGNSDDLEIGTDIIVVGWSHGNGINVKTGIVSMFVIDTQFDPKGGTIKDVAFMTTTPVNSGDSGSPALANRDGKYEIVGIVCSKARDHGLGFAYYSNWVQSVIQKILETSNES